MPREYRTVPEYKRKKYQRKTVSDYHIKRNKVKHMMEQAERQRQIIHADVLEAEAILASKVKGLSAYAPIPYEIGSMISELKTDYEFNGKEVKDVDVIYDAVSLIYWLVCDSNARSITRSRIDRVMSILTKENYTIVKLSEFNKMREIITRLQEER
jgi:hypothetical protein